MSSLRRKRNSEANKKQIEENTNTYIKLLNKKEKEQEKQLTQTSRKSKEQTYITIQIKNP